jgi:KDO2-lipid IV(A) lauroyltransferase
LLTISEKELNRRVKGNWEVFRKLNDEGVNAYALLGHTFNWEWANVACQYNAPQQFAGVYMPVKNEGLNRLMEKMRTRGGGWLISMKGKKAFQRLEGVRYIVGLIADQNPSNLNGAVWLPFMNREAPFYKGPETLARRARAAVVTAGIKRTGRGYYEINLQLLIKDASLLTEGEIMKYYVLFMEQQLREQPSNWLWTHKRWKHKRNAKAPATT